MQQSFRADARWWAQAGRFYGRTVLLGLCEVRAVRTVWWNGADLVGPRWYAFMVNAAISEVAVGFLAEARTGRRQAASWRAGNTGFVWVLRLV